MSPSRLETVIKRLRTERGLTQIELARKAKVTQTYVAKIEGGDRLSPSLPRPEAPRQGPRRAGDGASVVSAGAYLRRVWLWAAVLTLIVLGGCAGAQDPLGPAPAPPLGCVDAFSGRVSRSCL
jgi:hypothetical protein